MLGAAGVRFAGFLVAALASFPQLLLEVYFGFAGKHFARMVNRSGTTDYLKDSVVLIGLLLTVAVIVLIARIAGKALKDAIPDPAPGAAGARP